MSSLNFLFVEDEECQSKINIDELYERNFQRDMRQMSVFNKILNRIHKRITASSRSQQDLKTIWFVVPQFIFGEPTYDQAECIAYCVKQLTDNGFSVRYVHPHTLVVSWENWIPSYVRTKIKKKTGMVINEKGEVIATAKEGEDGDPELEDGKLLNSLTKNAVGTGSDKPKYVPIDQYKPSGNLVYNMNLLHRINEKTGI